MRLSICMMVKNEAHNLHRCLESLNFLRESVDSELIIIDTGSDDETVEIAKQYTDKVYFRPWNNDFAEMRNITISYATGEWIFIIDADEVLSEENGIIQFLKENNKKFVAAAIRLFNIIDSKGTVGPTLNTMRLFLRTKDFRYESRIHNTPVVNGKVKEITGTLTHYGYVSDDLELMERKFQRTSKILLEELEKNPNNVYYRFQLGSTYDMHNDLELSVKAYGEAFETVNREGYDWREYLYILGPYVKVLSNVNKFEEAKTISDFGLAIEPDYLDLIYFDAISSLKVNQVDEGIYLSLQFLDKLKNIKKLPIYSNPSIQLYTLNSRAECLHNLAYAYKLQNNFMKMSECAHLLLESVDKDSPFYGGAVALAIEADCFNNDTIKILELYERVNKSNWAQLDELLVAHTESSLYTELNLKLEWLAQLPSVLGDLYRSITEEELFMPNDINNLIEYGVKKHIPITIFSALKNNVEISLLIKLVGNEAMMNLLGRADERYAQLNELIRERYSALSDVSSYEEILEKYVLSKYLMIKTLGSQDELVWFDRFVQIGIILIEKKYTIDFIKALDYYRFNYQEEWFMAQVWHLINCENNIEAVLNEALAAMPEWNLIFLKWFNTVSEESETKKNNELETLKNYLTVEINRLVDMGDAYSALQVVTEYLSIFPKDLEMLMFKAELATKMI